MGVNMIIKDADLTIEDLIEIPTMEEPVYSSLEADFLREFAPYAFTQMPLPGLLPNPHAIIELNQTVFDVVAKLDVSVMRNNKLEQLAKEKADLINPILSAFHIDGIVVGYDYLSALFKIKTKGLEFLALTTDETGFEREIIGETENSFKAERRDLYNIFGDIPMLIFGSALVKENPGDIDTVVFPEGFTLETYKTIMKKYNPNRNPPLSFVIIPKAYIVAYTLSDAYQSAHPANSVMMNGSIQIPMVSEEYLNKLRIHRVAGQYIQIRKSLTPSGLDECEGILPRINNRLKLPGFIHRDLSAVSKTQLPEPTIKKFTSLPTKDEFIRGMVEANLQIYRILTTYLKT